jgi:hypothetical protein|tara:strand:- start:757 stop:987 length:231 start_codon:yes stop_codon:yes gene_type:complete
MSTTKVYRIHWLDAWCQGAGWEDPPKQDGVLCETVGFIVDETKEMLTVAGSYDGTKYYQQMMSIPKAIIKSKKVLK